jgi:hypothetical protein
MNPAPLLLAISWFEVLIGIMKTKMVSEVGLLNDKPILVGVVMEMLK